MYMIKSNGGSGTVTGVSFNNFMGHSNAYTLDFDTAWSSMDTVDGDGINYSNISFSGWSGTCESGTTRGPIKINCPADTPCTDITVEDFSVWTDDGDEVLYGCQNAYGSGACLKSGDSGSTYTTTQTITTGSGSYSTMDNELTTGYDISSSIPIPTMPSSFYPGREPISAILSGSAATATAAAASSAATSSSVAVAADIASTSSSFATSYTSSSKTTSTKKSKATTTSASSGKDFGKGKGAVAADSSSAVVTAAPSAGTPGCSKSAKLRRRQ